MEHKNSTSRIITEAARNQFDSSFTMLRTLVDVCPEEVWYEYQNEVPFWYQVYHVTYFIDYWFRDVYNDEEFRCMIFDERIPPEFEHEISREISVSREDIIEYLTRIHVKTSRIFDILEDEQMAVSVFDKQMNFTYTDVIMAQIRHIMYNIGYLNGILRSKGIDESDWYAYNEEDN
jgi:hypothetical protein